MRALLPGQLAYVFLIAILDAALISWIALRWYRRAVKRLMSEGASQRTDVALAASSAPSPTASATASLSVALLQPMQDAVPIGQRSNESGIAWLRLAVAYCLGAALHSAVITAFVLAPDSSHPLAAWFAQWWVFAWPIVPT